MLRRLFAETVSELCLSVTMQLLLGPEKCSWHSAFQTQPSQAGWVKQASRLSRPRQQHRQRQSTSSEAHLSFKACQKHPDGPLATVKMLMGPLSWLATCGRSARAVLRSDCQLRPQPRLQQRPLQPSWQNSQKWHLHVVTAESPALLEESGDDIEAPEELHPVGPEEYVSDFLKGCHAFGVREYGS